MDVSCCVTGHDTLHSCCVTGHDTLHSCCVTGHDALHRQGTYCIVLFHSWSADRRMDWECPVCCGTVLQFVFQVFIVLSNKINMQVYI
jgi:hypothetical protein